MRKAEQRMRSRRSGRRPELEGPWEEASGRYGVVVVEKGEMTYLQRRRRERLMRDTKRAGTRNKTGASRREAGREMGMRRGRGGRAAAVAPAAAAAATGDSGRRQQVQPIASSTARAAAPSRRSPARRHSDRRSPAPRPSTRRSPRDAAAAAAAPATSSAEKKKEREKRWGPTSPPVHRLANLQFPRLEGEVEEEKKRMKKRREEEEEEEEEERREEERRRPRSTVAVASTSKGKRGSSPSMNLQFVVENDLRREGEETEKEVNMCMRVFNYDNKKMDKLE